MELLAVAHYTLTRTGTVKEESSKRHTTHSLEVSGITKLPFNETLNSKSLLSHHLAPVDGYNWSVS